MKTLEQEFYNPSAAYRGKPFWAWNGKLEEQELLRQIDVLHDMGFGGFFMHSRTGLQTEYLGDDWFRLTDACVKKRGHSAWSHGSTTRIAGPAAARAVL